MTNTRKPMPRYEPSPPLNLPLGMVYVTKEAIKALARADMPLDVVLARHSTGYGADFDYEERFENYATASAGGDNHSVHDLTENEQIRVHTLAHYPMTIVSLYLEAE